MASVKRILTPEQYARKLQTNKESNKRNRGSINAYLKRYRAANKEKIAKRRSKHRFANRAAMLAQEKAWKAANKEKVIAYVRKWQRNNPEKNKEINRRWVKSNPLKIRYHNNKHRTLRMKRIPKWANLLELQLIYTKCPRDMTVDHIIPLQGKDVSGLHVPWNLQYLTRTENSFKKNKFDGTYTNETWRMLMALAA